MLTRQASLDEATLLMSHSLLDERIERGAAALNREIFAANDVLAVCFAGRRKSGKTALIESTLTRFDGRLRAGVVVGNINACSDAARLRDFCEQVCAIETDDLTATLLHESLDHLDLEKLDVLFVERGAAEEPWNQDLGQSAFVEVCAADGEGRERGRLALCGNAVSHADLLLLTKCDLLSTDRQLDVDAIDVAEFVRAARDYNRDATIIPVSLVTGRGMREWCEWLQRRVEALQAATRA